MADEVGVMNAGRIEQWGTPHDLYHRPASRFVAGFVGQGVFVPGEVDAELDATLDCAVTPEKGI